jgi:hypothetical protein
VGKRFKGFKRFKRFKVDRVYRVYKVYEGNPIIARSFYLLALLALPQGKAFPGI